MSASPVTSNPPQRRSGVTRQRGSGLDSPNPSAKPPTPDGPTFRDLLIFEERLKQNAARLLRRKRKYQTTLALLCGVILFLAYHVAFIPKAYPPLHYAQLACLVVSSTTLFLFFASGMYAERIVAANRFVPQANRALRPFNMYLNTRPPPKVAWWKRVLPFVDASSPIEAGASSPRSPGAGNNGGATQTRLVRTTANDGSASPTPTVRRVPIPPIPPSSNPRGEIIFSNRVSPAFREGYERYRNAFERRRREKLEAATRESASWPWRFWVSTSAQGKETTGGAEAYAATPKGGNGDQQQGSTPTSSSNAGAQLSRTGGKGNGSGGRSASPTARVRQQHLRRERSDSASSSASGGSSSAHHHTDAAAEGQAADAAPSGSASRSSSPRTRARELMALDAEEKDEGGRASRRSSVSSSGSSGSGEGGVRRKKKKATSGEQGKKRSSKRASVMSEGEGETQGREGQGGDATSMPSQAGGTESPSEAGDASTAGGEDAEGGWIQVARR